MLTNQYISFIQISSGFSNIIWQCLVGYNMGASLSFWGFPSQALQMVELGPAGCANLVATPLVQ